MAFDPNTDIADATVRALYAAAKTAQTPTLSRAAAAAKIQDCAIALVQLGVYFAGGGVTTKAGKCFWMGDPVADPKTLGVALLALGPKGETKLDDVALVDLAAQILAALQEVAQ